jgi:hypothetical protein
MIQCPSTPQILDTFSHEADRNICRCVPSSHVDICTCTKPEYPTFSLFAKTNSMLANTATCTALCLHFPDNVKLPAHDGLGTALLLQLRPNVRILGAGPRLELVLLFDSRQRIVRDTKPISNLCQHTTIIPKKAEEKTLTSSTPARTPRSLPSPGSASSPPPNARCPRWRRSTPKTPQAAPRDPSSASSPKSASRCDRRTA